MSRPRFPDVVLLFLRIGNTTFGGGDPTMAALQRELVERRRWITGEQYGLCYSLARVTPGTNVLAFCAGAAWLVRGWAASVLAVTAASLPSAMLAVWVLHTYEAWSSRRLVQAMFGGMVAAVVGIMVASALSLYWSQARGRGVFRGAVLAATAAVLSGGFGLPPVLILAAVGLLGLAWKESA